MITRPKALLGTLAGPVLVCLVFLMFAASGAVDADRILERAAGIPLSFEANRGQADAHARFVARGLKYQFMISPTEAQLFLCRVEGLGGDYSAGRENQASAPQLLRRGVRLEFTGANPQARVAGEDELPGKINYLLGNDPSQWHVGVPTYAKVKVSDLYAGIDLVYYGNQQ